MRSGLPAAILVLVLAGLSLSLARTAVGAVSPDLPQMERLRDNVDVQADRIQYSEKERRVVASGTVRVVMGARTLFADEVSVDLDEQTVVASGNVILMEGLNRLEGDRMEYNYRTNLGTIVNGRGALDTGVSFSGVEVRREGERQYSVTEARFTACRACQPEPATPDWEFRASEATIYQDEWIASWNTSFWVKGIPALFSPAVALPIGPRRSGFLIPRVGYNNQDGFMIRQPFFWAISRSQDATLTGIYRTKRGFEFDGEYRYVLDERSRGVLTGRYLHDLEPGDQPPDRGEVKWVHDQVLAPTWTFKADAGYQTDPTVNRDFIDSSVTDRTQRVLDSNIFVAQTTPQYVVLGLVGTTQDLSEFTANRWLARLPEIRFQWLPGSVLGSPLLAEADASAVYFLRSEAEDAGRLDLRPAVHLPLTLWPWLTSTTSAALYETAYTLSSKSGGSTNRLLFDLRQRFGTTLLRRFEEPGLGFSRLTHVVESSVGYQYVPWVDQQSFLQFDRLDFVNPQNRVTYRLASRLMGRSPGPSGEARTYEVASLSVTQSVNLQPKTREFSDVYLQALTPERVDQAVVNLRPLSNGFTRATERRLSNLVFQAGVRPRPHLAGYATVAVDVERPEVAGVNSGIEVRLWDGLTVEAGQSYVRDRQLDGIVAKIYWQATRNVSLDLFTRYDLRSGTLFENTATLRFSTCCWEVGVKYTHRTRGPGQPDQNDVQVAFNLRMPNTPAGP
jgi:LPS-assembly protein